MHRSRILFISISLALAGVVIPLVVAYHIAWSLAVKAEQERMTFFGNLVLQRANIAFDEAKQALHSIVDSNLEPCSAEHIAEMRRLTLNTRSVEEMGYFENRILKCTSWGTTESRVEQSHTDYVASGGIAVTAGIRPTVVSRGTTMTGLQYQSYNALVNPARFVDIVVDPDIQLAIVSASGILIAERNAPDPDLLGSIINRPSSGIDETNVFATARTGDWTAVAIETQDGVFTDFGRQQMLLLPVGTFIAAFIVGIVVWLSRKRLSPVGELAIAVRNREFIVHYQPIIELETGICIGAEALVRWQRPDGLLVRPDIFIPLAEESGLIMPITDQVIEAVVLDLNRLLVADRSLHIAINLCAEDIKTGRILGVITAALEHTGIRPQQIWLEATERGLMDIGPARSTIDQARQLGHAVAIDDFGTGYSSLQYLQGLPMDALKIDKSFIETIDRDTATSSVTPHIIDMAKTLKLRIVAEGIETEAQAEYLRARHVEFGQGWLFSKALPAAEFIAFYRRNKEQFDSTGSEGPHAILSEAPIGRDLLA